MSGSSPNLFNIKRSVSQGNMFQHALKVFNENCTRFHSLYNDEVSDEDELTENMTDSMTDSINRSGVKGLKWTKTEDNMLKTLVEQYGEKWDLIALELKDRSDIQCQQRWTKVVNPDLIKGPWTKEVNTST